MRFLIFAVALSCGFAASIPIQQSLGDAKQKPKAKLSLDEAYRNWHQGFSSKDKADREKALQSMLPTKKDVEYLFPKHAEKLWPKWVMGNQFLMDNVDKIAAEVTAGGALIKVDAIDVRAEKDRAQGYKRLFEMIPKDVPVFDIAVKHEKRGSGGGSYLYMNDRWLWIKDLDAFPEILDKLK